ncbi:MAG: CapA family protein [Candidatus Kerfeldbacteria bacterium]
MLSKKTVGAPCVSVAITFMLGVVCAVSLCTEKVQAMVLLPTDHTVTMVAVGDVMLSRNVGTAMTKRNDYNYPFLKTRNLLKKGDIVFCNLETAIFPGRPIKTGEMSFRSDVQVARAMKDAGFTVVSLANNHVPNFGAKGIADTLKYLDKAGIAHVGAGANVKQALKAATMTVNDVRFSILAYNDSDVVPASYGATEKRAGTALMDVTAMVNAVKAAKKTSDIVIVSMHSGTEYKATPNARQQRFARAAIDAGAVIVIGHHPHVVQSVEKYKGKWIIYSLGNFVFDQMWSVPTRQGVMASIIFTKEGVSRIDYTPVQIENYAQPRVLTGAEAKAVLARLKLPE